MEKNLQKPKRTPRTGILSEAERTAIQQHILRKQQKSKLTSLKNGTLLKALEAFGDDLRIILKDEEFAVWADDYRVRRELEKISALISNNYGFLMQPTFRIATKKDGQNRVYYLKKIDYSGKFPKTTDDLLVVITKGLQLNQRLLIREYVENVGYIFPLDESEVYSWKEVKSKLENRIANPPKTKPISNKGQETFRKNMNDAWTILRSNLDSKSREKIRKLGFEIKFIQNKQYLN